MMVSLSSAVRSKPCRVALLAAFFAAIAPSRAHAKVIWRGDFSTGDLSQWPEKQYQSPDRLTVVTSPVRHGPYALRTELRQGDLSHNGCRAELVNGTMELEGADRWYAWSTLVPSDYPVSSDWQVFTQWHHNGNTGSPPLEFDLKNGDAQLTTRGSITVWSAPLSRGAWHDFVFHVKFSPSASVGFVELWLDGVKVIDHTAMATMYAGPGEGMWLKQGLYRNARIVPTAVIFHAGMIEGETLDDVSPSLTPPPPPPPPPPAAGDFALAVNPAAQNVLAGAPASYLVSVARSGGFAGTVALSAHGLPAGVTASVEPASATSATVIVQTSAGAALGSYAFTIDGVSGSLAHSAPATLSISAASTPDFALSVQAPAEAATPGSQGTFAISLARAPSFTDVVTLSASGLPAGATASTEVATGTSASLTVALGPDVPPGSYPFVLIATSGAVSHSAPATLIVKAQAAGAPAVFHAGGCASTGSPLFLSALGLLFLLRKRRPAQAARAG